MPHAKLTPMLPLHLIHHVMLLTRLLHNRHFGSACNGQFIVALVLLFNFGRISSDALGDSACKEGNGEECRGGSGDSKDAEWGGRCVGGLGLGDFFRISHGRNVGTVHMERKEGGDLGEVVGFFVGGDGTVEEDGDGSVDDLAVCIGMVGDAGI